MIISNLWRRLNFLVPEPICRTKGDEYSDITWDDARPIPTTTELLAISGQEMADEELNIEAGREIDSNRLNKLIFSINFNQENRLRIIENKPELTKEQYRIALIAEYKAGG